MCIAAGDITNDIWLRYVGFAYIAILDVSVGSGSSSWEHIADGGVRTEYSVSW